MSDRPLKYKWVVSARGNPYVALKNAAGDTCSVMYHPRRSRHWRVFVRGEDAVDFSTVEEAFEYARARLPD